MNRLFFSFKFPAAFRRRSPYPKELIAVLPPMTHASRVEIWLFSPFFPSIREKRGHVVPSRAAEKNELHNSSSRFEATELPATVRYPTCSNRGRFSAAVDFCQSSEPSAIRWPAPSSGKPKINLRSARAKSPHTEPCASCAPLISCFGSKNSSILYSYILGSYLSLCIRFS